MSCSCTDRRVLVRTLWLLVFCICFATRAFAEDRSGVRPEVLSLPTGPGSVQGLGTSFDPAPNTGMAGYEVAIEVPPAVNGFVPELALRYSSAAGNGELGMGWTLGLPAVERSTDRRLPTYDESDVITLRGMGGGSEELVKLTDGSYRFRIEGAFVRGRQREDGSWEFRNRSGIRFRFGQGSAVVADGDRVFTWMLSEQEDTFGNRIRYEYDLDDTGRPYLAHVVYNDFGAAYRNEVVLHWETRPDPLTSHLAGFPVTVAHRLARVEVRHGAETIRTYTLAYEDLLGLSRLMRVEMVGRDGMTALPPVTFGYADFAPENAAVVEMAGGPTRGVGEDGEISDMNGDALPDLLVTDPSTDGGRYRWYPNLDGASFGDAQVMKNSPSVWLEHPGVQLADMDGNGEADMVAKLSFTADGFRFYPSIGGEFVDAVTITPNPSFSFEDADVRLLDINHDKLTDWLRIDPNTGELTAAFNRGSGRFSQTAKLGRLDPREVLAFSRGLRTADMNGDGLTDLVMVRSGSVRMWPGQGERGFGAAEALDRGPILTTQEEAGIQVRDLNGDGLADLVFVGVQEVRYWLNLAAATFAKGVTLEAPPHSSNTVVRIADMNGNGTADFVWTDPDGSAPWQYLDVLPHGTPGLLNRIENGLGKVVTIEYAGMAEMRAWERSIGWEGSSRNPIGQMVVRAVTVSDSLENAMRTEYRYGGGYYHPLEREFRGFSYSEVSEVGDETQPTLITARQFDLGHEDEALKGMMRSSERRDEDGHVFDRIENFFALREIERAVGDVRVRYGFVRQTDTLVYEGTREPRTLRSEWDHDAYGNVVFEALHGEVCGDDTSCGDDEKLTRRAFAIHPGAWVVDRVATERIEDANGTRVAETRTYYDGEAFAGLALGQVERGAVTRTETWVDGERFVSNARFEHDAFGNPKVLLNPHGGRREVEYDAETHTFPVTERQWLNDARSIAWRVTGLDRAFGAALELEGPNGDVTKYRYDALGRPTAIIEEGDTEELPTRLFTYDLGSPLSTVRDEQREESGKPGTIVSLTDTDGLGRVRSEAREGSRDGEWVYENLGKYGPRGWLGYRALPGFGTLDTPPADWAVRGTELQYDATGREVMTRELDGAETRTEYSSLARTVWDANDTDPESPHYDTPSTYLEDGQGRVRMVIEREGDREITTARYGYSPLDDITRMEDAAGRVRAYGYDGRSKLTHIEDPNAGAWLQTYTDAGDLERRTDPTGRTVRYTHDALGRVLEEWHALPGGKEALAVHFHYDAPSEDHPELENIAGRLAWVEDAAGAVFHGYSSRGLLSTRIRRWKDGSEHTTWTDFDAADRPTRRGYPNGSFLPYTYDARGLLRATGPVASDIGYTAAGQLEVMRLGNGVLERRHHDVRGRLTRLEARKGDKTRRDLELSLDKASRITATIDHQRKSEDPLSLSAKYTFDDRYRLLTVTDVMGATAWAYDDVANLLSVASDYADGFLNVENLYEDATHPDRITRHGHLSIKYDEAGRVIDDGERKLSWDAKGRLARVERGDLIEEYTYAHDDGRALKRTTKAGKTEDVRYIDADAEERGGSLVRYVFVGKERVARLDSMSGKQVAKAEAANCALTRRADRGWLWLSAALGLLLLDRRRRWMRGALALLAVVAVSCSPASDVRANAHAIETLPNDAVFYLTDHHDSPVVVLDAAGAVVEEHAQHAYGTERAPMSAEPWAFAGNELDATELGNFHARPYDSRLGRFLAVDPEPLFAPDPKNPVAFEAYSYAAGDPINLADPSGRSIWTKLVKVGVKAWKTGSAADAFVDNVKDAITLVNPAASPIERVMAGVSLASELLPVSVGDLKDVGKAGSAALGRFRAASRINESRKALPGPKLPNRIADTFEGSEYVNRKLENAETFYKYHGKDNRTGRQFTWFSNKKYADEDTLRRELAVRDDWGVNITARSEFEVPAGSWVSEGRAAAQGKGYPGGGYQAVAQEVPRAWVVRTDRAF